ncbi:MAG TPA: HAD family hydrolase [Ktedonobacterales bacterium]|nr:HAD family hydrolase [Ktedonobacterales bacterium]
MRRIRLVVTDVDGTLLDPGGCLTPRTREAIQALAASGVALALATGRRWTGASVAASSFDFRGPMIHMDGAMIRTYPDGEMLHSAPLDRVVAQRAAEVMAGYGVQPIAQYSNLTDDFLHVSQEAAHPEWTATYLPAFQQQTRYRPVAQLCDIAVDPIRLAAFAPLSILRRVAVDLASHDCGRQLLLLGNYGVAELTLFSSAVSKGNALKILAHHLAIPLDETMAIGDGANDISMLRAAGVGVAMGQAPRRVRAIADAVTTSNAEDGLARAIEQYALGWAERAS